MDSSQLAFPSKQSAALKAASIPPPENKMQPNGCVLSLGYAGIYGHACFNGIGKVLKNRPVFAKNTTQLIKFVDKSFI
jgi:hypothetical protein